MANAKEARIDMYFHCKNCMDLDNMDTGEKLAVGWTKEGLQVVCENCGHSVIDLDFKGQKVGYYEKI